MAALDDRDPRVREGALGSLALLFSTGEVASHVADQSDPDGRPQVATWPGSSRCSTTPIPASGPAPGRPSRSCRATSTRPCRRCSMRSGLESGPPNSTRIARPSNRGIGPAVALRRAKASKSSVPVLVAALGATEVPRVRILAASVLSRIGPDAADAIPHPRCRC